MTETPTAGETVLAYVADQVRILREGRSDVLADVPDAVHKSRVATRRLRSTLRTFPGVQRRGVARSLRDELRWLGEELGAPRDAEVLRERLLEEVSGLPDADRRLIASRIDQALTSTHDAAHAELVAAMATKRYRRLLRSMGRLVAEPEFGPMADEPAAGALPAMFARAVHRVERLAAHAASRPSDLSRWHEVRKAAKAARYAAEVLEPVMGEPAERSRAAWEAVTEALGAVQDAVVAQRVIGELALQAGGEGLPRTPFDDLRQRQDALLRESLDQGRRALVVALGAGRL